MKHPAGDRAEGVESAVAAEAAVAADGEAAPKERSAPPKAPALVSGPAGPDGTAGPEAARRRHARVRELFAAARELAPEHRAAHLTAACGDDEELKAEVESLLAVEGSEGAIETADLAAVLSPDLPSSDAPTGEPPSRVPGFRILGLLGEGGMGTVYEAEQESPRRRVALKVLGSGPRSPEALGRFRREAELLGRLQHPGIAQVHAAGVAEEPAGALPYFAMELVRGEPLSRHVALRGASRGERLELIAQVAEAVQHAHARGIVHRDLKPANILVDGAGQVKVLDFGIAKLLDEEARTLETRTGTVLGTVASMSPEQVQGKPADIDARSDVYSIGILAYELLAGRHPLPLEGTTLPQALRMVAEHEPARLSSVDRSLRGDLDAIVGKALERDPTRRYQTAHELAQDIRRYLRHESVTARPATLGYQLGKFARRNRALVAGAGASLLLLVLGVIGTSVGFVKARSQRDAARSSLDEADRVTDFLSQMLASVEPGAMGREVTVRDVLDAASLRLERDLAEQDRPRARLEATLGSAYLALGASQVAEGHFRRAAALRAIELGPDDALTLDASSALAVSLTRQARHAEAQSLFEELRERYARAHPEAHPGALEARLNAAELVRQLGDNEASAREFERVLAVARAHLGRDHRTTLSAAGNLAVVYQGLGRLGDADALLREELATRRRLLGDDHPDTLIALSNLGANLYYEEKLDEAAELWEETLERRERVLGLHHASTLKSLSNLAELRGLQERPEEAIVLLERALPVQRELLGPDHPDTARTLKNLAGKHYQLGRYEEAATGLEEALAAQRRTLGEDHGSTLGTLSNLAHAYRKLGRIDEAEAAFAEAARRGARIWPEGRSLLALFLREHGRTLQQLGRLEEAEHELVRAEELYIRILGPDDCNRVRTTELLAELRRQRSAMP